MNSSTNVLSRKRRLSAYQRKYASKHQDVYNVFSFTETKSTPSTSSYNLGINVDFILVTRAADSTSHIAVSTNNTTWFKNVVGDNLKENIEFFINKETHILEEKNGTTTSLSSQNLYNVLIQDQTDSAIDLSDLAEHEQHQKVSCSARLAKMKKVKSPKTVREEKLLNDEEESSNSSNELESESTEITSTPLPPLNSLVKRSSFMKNPFDKGSDSY
ncbi:hypothetical protein GEMRC1_012918 [Eukaryota sp. GEM-RC1]